MMLNSNFSDLADRGNNIKSTEMVKISKKKEATGQHHVPKVYLKNFCSKEGRISVLDTFTEKVFSASLDNVGKERDYYTLDKLDDPYCWEHAYANGIEPLMNKIIPRILSKINVLVQSGTPVMDESEKAHMAIIMVIQMLRGQQCREYESRIFQSELPGIIERAKTVFGHFTSKEQSLVQAYQEDEFYFKRSIMDASLSPERIRRYAEVLYNRNISLFYLRGDLEFVSSDNPVMFINSHTADATPFTNGLLQESTLVYYPLSPKVLLCATHPEAFFRALSKTDCCLVPLSSGREEKFIHTINKKQAEQCYRQVYAQSQETLNEFLQCNQR